MANRPEPEREITNELVQELLRSQFPDLATLPLRELSRGWDNTNFRLGDDLIVRVPHRQAAEPLVVHEQRWLPVINTMVDIAVPSPTHAGTPTTDYPWHWSVTPFFAGTDAAGAELADPAATAQLLGEFFAQLHVSAPADAPPNPYRGCPIEDRRASFEKNLAAVSRVVPQQDRDAMTAVFNAACATPAATERVWLHGDLHARNMIVHQGELAAVIDWGDICSGDRATDLAGAFMLVPEHLDVVRQYAGASIHDWERARGWAANFAIVYLSHSDDDAVMDEIGRRLLAALLTV